MFGGDRLGDANHAVEHLNGDGHLALLNGQRPSTKLQADTVLVSANRGLDEVAPAVARRPLPADAVRVGHQPDVPVAQAWGVDRVRAGRHRRAGAG